MAVKDDGVGKKQSEQMARLPPMSMFARWMNCQASVGFVPTPQQFPLKIGPMIAVSDDGDAMSLGLHQTHVGRLERGEKIPNAAIILKTVDIFSVTADQLMRDELELDA